jgi:DNA-binding transcriptional regulator GbsR (MarR family)
MNKIKLERNKNYTTISNIISKDKRVGLAERGLFLTIMSLPDNWNLTISGLEEILLESKDKISKTINKLIELGYCERVQVKNQKNHFNGYNYTFYEKPKTTINPKPIFPKSENPYTEKPDTENPQQLSKQELNTNKENIYIENQNLTDTDKQLQAFNNILNTDAELKQEFEELPKPLNIDTDYYNQFLEKWNIYAEKYKDRKVKLSSLQSFDKQNLKTINKPIEEISKALFILFNQNNIIETCLVTPKHFLIDFHKYYQAGLEFEKSKKQKENIIQFYKSNN